MNKWQWLAHVLFGREYVLALIATSSPTSDPSYKVKRAYKKGGIYFLRGEYQFTPLLKHRMCRTAFELTVSNSNMSAGMIVDRRWSPLTLSLRAYYDMLPSKDDMASTEDAGGVQTFTHDGTDMQL